LPRKPTIDYEKFRELWNKGVPTTHIAQEVGCSVPYVSKLRRRLDLPTRGRWGSNIKRQRKKENILDLMTLIKKHGCTTRAELLKMFSYNTILSAVRERKIRKLNVGIGQGRGRKKYLIRDLLKDLEGHYLYFIDSEGLLSYLTKNLPDQADVYMRKAITALFRHVLTRKQLYQLYFKKGYLVTII
jgi:hypothetical protein